MALQILEQAGNNPDIIDYTRITPAQQGPWTAETLGIDLEQVTEVQEPLFGAHIREVIDVIRGLRTKR